MGGVRAGAGDRCGRPHAYAHTARRVPCEGRAHAGPLHPRIPASRSHRVGRPPGAPRAARRRHHRAHVPPRRAGRRACRDLRLRARAAARARRAHRSARPQCARTRADHPADLRRAVNPSERVTGALGGQKVDRVPFAVWRHFYPDENEGPAKLAETTIAFTKRHQLDLIKYNPRAHYHAEPWGTRYRYGKDGHPVLERYAVRKPEDWARIGRKSVREPAFQELLSGMRLVREVLPDTPLVATIFTPLGVLERLAGAERVLADLRAHTDAVVAALDAVAETFAELAAACIEYADGIFLATTVWARRDTLYEGEYRR